MNSHSQAREIPSDHAVEQAAAQLAEAFPALHGAVLSVEDDRVLIDLGSTQKVYQGMELQVYREGEEVKHPVSGLVLGRRDKRLGLLRVADVKEAFSETVVVFREAEATIATGDLVRVSHDRITVALPLIEPGEARAENLQTLTKDLAIALANTGRFIVIEDHLVRAALMGEEPVRLETFTEPAVLKALGEKARVQLLVLGKLRVGEAGTFLNLQGVSVSTGSPLTVSSVELTGSRPRMLGGAPTPSAPAPAERRAPAFVKVQPAQPSEKPGVAPPVTPARRPVVARQAEPQPGTPSFLIKGEDSTLPPEELAAKDHVTFDLSESLLAVAAGDLDGDGRPEIVGITTSEVIAYRWQDRQMEPIARAELKESFIRHLHLDVADVHGDGHAQIFVTAMSSVPEGLKLRNALRSYVLELRQGQFVRIADNLGYFMRVLTGPGLDAPMLLGQRMGDRAAFTGPVVRLVWSGERYVEDQPLALPAQVRSLYDFAPLEIVGNQVTEAAVITEQGQINAFGRGGEALWEGKDDLGQVDHLAFYQTPELQALRFKHGIRSGIPANPEEYADRLVLPRRVIVRSSPLWGEGKTELLTVANSTRYGVQIALGSGVGGPSGRVVAYDRRDGTIARGWETVPVQGTVRDIAVIEGSGAGRTDLIVLSAVSEKGFVATLKDRSRGVISVFSFRPSGADRSLQQGGLPAGLRDG